MLQQLKAPTAVLTVLAGLAGLSPGASIGCTLILGTGGHLGPDMNGTEMSTEGTGGITGSLTVASLSSSTITVEAPTFSAPSGFTSGRAEVAYAGLSGLVGVNQVYTNQRTSFVISGIAFLNPALVTIRNRIKSNAGLPSGDYSTTTVITCS